MWVFFGIKTKHMIPCSSDWFNFHILNAIKLILVCFFFWFFFIEGDTYNATTTDMA